MINSSVRKARKTKIKSLVAPVGGLNGRDAIANMPEADAITMDNFFPETSFVSLRNGVENWVTGITSNVESLMAYNSGTVSKLFAAAGPSIYDVTIKSAVGPSVASGFLNARWQHVNFGNPSGQNLVICNGSDHVQIYNGTTWSASTITGVDDKLLIHVEVYKNRLFFVQKSSFSFWYLAVNAIGGAATNFDLSSLYRLGGYLMCIVPWTVQNASGTSDYLCFVSSQGEVVMYQGSDPSSPSSWSIAGQFRIGRPIGRRCYQKIASDVVMITADGAYPFSKALLMDRTASSDAISDKISNLINMDIQAYGNNFGWQPILYPIGNKAIINVPFREGSASYQYVMNTITGSWCRFTGLNAFCWEIFGDGIYYGGADRVVHADYGDNDFGLDITGECQQAFSYFEEQGTQKLFTMARLILQSNAIIQASIKINTDFDTSVPTSSATYSYGPQAIWNVSPWDTTYWTQGITIYKDWQSVYGIGFVGSTHIKLSLSNATLNWQSTDIGYETGGIL